MVSSVHWAERTKTDREILREYYLENNFFTSPEGVLKVLSIVACAASPVLWALGGGCAAAAGAAAAGAAAAALLALHCAAHALRLARHAPVTCFYLDVVSSSAAALALLAAGALGLARCAARRALDHVHGPLAVLSAALVLSSAVVTYGSVLRRRESARRPPPRPAPPTRRELDV